MAISPALVAEVLSKCARHCCICRRFRPLYLQVHHIDEQAAGGGDEFGNLMPICVSCHCDVHTQTKLTRRFTIPELQLHRDNVYRLVTEGKLPSGRADDDGFTALSAPIVALLRNVPPPAGAVPELTREAIEILLAAATSNQPIDVLAERKGMIFLTADRQFGSLEDLRVGAMYRHGKNLLLKHHLVEGASSPFLVTYAGYLVADDIGAAAEQARSGS
jgi:HNH endonuclease